MKTATVLQFSDLIVLSKYIRVIHASSYRIDTTKLTVKLHLTDFEVAIAVEQYNAVIVEQTESVK